MINGHALCPPLSFARGCDPVPVRNRSPGGAPAPKWGRTTCTVRGQWKCLETATTVTECGWSQTWARAWSA